MPGELVHTPSGLLAVVKARGVQLLDNSVKVKVVFADQSEKTFDENQLELADSMAQMMMRLNGGTGFFAMTERFDEFKNKPQSEFKSLEEYEDYRCSPEYNSDPSLGIYCDEDGNTTDADGNILN